MAWLGRVMKDLGKYAHDVQLGQDLLPPAAESLMRFDAARVVSAGWRAWSDAPHGGTSTATLSWRERPEGATDGDRVSLGRERRGRDGAFLPSHRRRRRGC